MAGMLGLLYGVVSYAIFLVTFLYAIAFVGGYDQLVPKAIDTGTPTELWGSIVVNLVLMSIFALQHSIMARPAFKAWWTKVVPPSVERSTYVLLSNAALILLYWQWRPMPEAVWDVQNEIGRGALEGLFFFGWLIVLISTFMIDHFGLFGLRQVMCRMIGKEAPHPSFKEPGLYKIVRHPIMLGFIIAFWAAPTMSQGHLLFAAVTTAYILVALQLEERDLMGAFGDKYVDYRSRVRMILPIPRKRP
ncbi:MAG TPA: NnrU family protein [Alphaproteobacteria bacterium]|jgi:protein-S-isoprenylcysteine O-methyltransferase Ste14|nr:NnrU family protein [Alphaproteobacteria bacterium]